MFQFRIHKNKKQHQELKMEIKQEDSLQLYQYQHSTTDQ